MISTTGRMPDIAAPSARPVNPASAIGVLRTRPGNFAARSFVAPYAPPPKFATSSPRTIVSAFFSSQRPVTAAIAFEYRIGVNLPKSLLSENFTPFHSDPSLRSPFSTESSFGQSPTRTLRGVPGSVHASTARPTASRARPAIRVISGAVRRPAPSRARGKAVVTSRSLERASSSFVLYPNALPGWSPA